MYQRQARDQALDEPDDNGAQADAASQAYADLYKYLEGNNDTEGLAALKHLMNSMTNGGAMDQPPPYTGRPTASALDADLRRSAVRSGQVQARQFLFNKRFPNIGRIRTVG
jgi:hypothetical protein